MGLLLINHIALVCKDMARTVDFYTNILGLTLIKIIALPDGGQHFFFKIDNGDALAFFWFPQDPSIPIGYDENLPQIPVN